MITTIRPIQSEPHVIEESRQDRLDEEEHKRRLESLLIDIDQPIHDLLEHLQSPTFTSSTIYALFDRLEDFLAHYRDQRPWVLMPWAPSSDSSVPELSPEELDALGVLIVNPTDITPENNKQALYSILAVLDQPLHDALDQLASSDFTGEGFLRSLYSFEALLKHYRRCAPWIINPWLPPSDSFISEPPTD